MSKKSFAQELRERIAPNQVLFFLKVVKRGLKFPLDGISENYRKVFVVPNMILAVIEDDGRHFVARWCGPTLETDQKNHPTEEYSENRSFTIDIPYSAIEDGSLHLCHSGEVVKMKNHVPAVLY